MTRLLIVLLATGLCVAEEPVGLRFAWPDGATASVQVTSEGQRRASIGDLDWKMSCEYQLRVKHADDRVIMSRDGFTGWRGAVPPSAAGGAGRFVEMIPTLVVASDGSFLGIEGQDEARRRMVHAVEASGNIDPAMKVLVDGFSSDDGMRAMASDHWALLAELWIDTEVDPEASYEFRGSGPVPQLGGGELEMLGTLRVIEETNCPPPHEAKRCVRLHAESAPNKEHVHRLLEALMTRVGAEGPRVTAFDQSSVSEILLEKATMLPHRLTLRRSSKIDFEGSGEKASGTEATETTYAFNWK